MDEMNENLTEDQNNLQQSNLELLPVVTSTYKVLDYLLRNQKNINFDKICELFNLTDSGLRSLIKRIRLMNNGMYKLIIKDKLISLKINGRYPNGKDVENNIIFANNKFGDSSKKSNINQVKHQSSQNNFIQNRFARNFPTTYKLYNETIELLKNNPNGISCDEISIKFNLNPQKIYSLIHSLRRKGYNIVNQNYHYILSDKPIVKKNKNITTESKNNYHYKNNEIVNIPKKNDLIPDNYSKAFQNLPEDDKIECIKLLKKSLYFHKSAIALLESNQIAYDFCENLVQGNI